MTDKLSISSHTVLGVYSNIESYMILAVAVPDVHQSNQYSLLLTAIGATQCHKSCRPATQLEPHHQTHQSNPPALSDQTSQLIGLYRELMVASDQLCVLLVVSPHTWSSA